MKKLLLFIYLLCFCFFGYSQDIKSDSALGVVDPGQHAIIDTVLRITNLNPYFTIHVDSVLNYELKINKDPNNYYWFLKEAPIGVKLDKSTGNLYFKAEKSFFRSGKLKYDVPYKVQLGVQNLFNPNERTDTALTILFYNTEINVSKLKPAIIGNLYVEEGDTVRFRIQCETGSFPFEQINYNSSYPISALKTIKRCDEEFVWWIPYDFIRDNDTTKQKLLLLQFIGSDKFYNKDTSEVRIFVRPGINFPMKYEEHVKVSNEMYNYVQTLKLTFYAVSKSIKDNKKTRTAFDISGSSTALLGTVISTAATTNSAKDVGKILPSIGLTLVPVKEAVAPSKIQEQNTAAQIRGVTKRLEYLLSENSVIGDRDPEVITKTKKMREELKQAQLQLIDLPLIEFDRRQQAEADKYFNDPKVIRKYKLKVS
ncbi:MAG: hypothetical protein ACO29O_05730 [Chitinophagaceae bacterium]